MKLVPCSENKVTWDHDWECGGGGGGVYHGTTLWSESDFLWCILVQRASLCASGRAGPTNETANVFHDVPNHSPARQPSWARSAQPTGTSEPLFMHVSTDYPHLYYPPRFGLNYEKSSLRASRGYSRRNHISRSASAEQRPTRPTCECAASRYLGTGKTHGTCTNKA